MLPSGPNAVRAVFYLDISDSDVERASELIGEALRNPERQPEETRSASTAHTKRQQFSLRTIASEDSQARRHDEQLVAHMSLLGGSNVEVWRPREDFDTVNYLNI
jgi:hypothetical protein